jgi:hypothetical protein
MTRCITGEELDIGNLRLTDLVADSEPLKDALIVHGCNNSMGVSVTQQPATFFFDIAITNLCQDDCCLDLIEGLEDGTGAWSTNFVESNCGDEQTNIELREDSFYELREDGGLELRE